MALSENCTKVFKMFEVVSLPVSIRPYSTSSKLLSFPNMKHAPVASVSETKVMFFGPMQRIKVVAQSDAILKIPIATVNWMETSYDFLCLIRAKKGMT